MLKTHLKSLSVVLVCEVSSNVTGEVTEDEDATLVWSIGAVELGVLPASSLKSDTAGNARSASLIL